MASFTVFEPGGTMPGSLEAADRAVFVRDGFSFAAFLFAPFWLLWRRMWLPFLLWLAFEVVLRLIGIAFHLDGAWWTALLALFAWAFALEANGLRCWTLRRRGWRFAGIACGHDLAEAESRHFEGRTFSGPDAPPFRPPPPQPPPVPPRRDAGQGAVLGLFPEPWGTRS